MLSCFLQFLKLLKMEDKYVFHDATINIIDKEKEW